jgi:hypothetical protein
MKIKHLIGLTPGQMIAEGHYNNYDNNRTGFRRRPREDDEYVNGDEDEVRAYNQHMDSPHDVHINGKKWKTFGSHSHASNVAKKIKGATVHKAMEEDWAPPGYGGGKPATNPDGTASAQRQADRAFDALQYSRGLNRPAPKPLVPGRPMGESATAGATSSANIGTVDAPHISPGKARGKKSYTGSPGTGSGTKAPPQPKVVQPKTKSGTAVNGLDIKGSSLFGGPANEAAVIKRR